MNHNVHEVFTKVTKTELNFIVFFVKSIVFLVLKNIRDQ